MINARPPNERYTKQRKVCYLRLLFMKRQRTSVNIKMCNATNIKTADVIAWLFNGVIYKNLVSPYTKYQNKWRKQPGLKQLSCSIVVLFVKKRCLPQYKK